MPTSPNRQRIEIDRELYRMLEARAEWLHVPVSILATILIREGLDLYERDIRPGPRSSLAAQIVREGSPSPTLATLQRHAEDELTK